MAKERPPLEEMTLRQLRKVASEYEISRYSRMRKSQLLKAIETAKLGDLVGKHDKQEKVEAVEARKFELGQQVPSSVALAEVAELAQVDQMLGDLPDGYGEARIVLLPRDPQWAYAYWDIPNDQKEACRKQGGTQLSLRICDTTDVNLDFQMPHSVQEYACDEMAREWYLPIPVSDRTYVLEIGYRCADGRWLMLARSASVHVPPVYPTDWTEDYFLAIPWEQNLIGRTFFTLIPGKRSGVAIDAYDDIFNKARESEAQRLAGSVFGSHQMAVAGSAQMAVAGSAQMAAAGSAQMAVAGSAQMAVAGSAQMAVAGSAQMAVAGSAQMAVAGSAQMAVAGSAQMAVAGSAQMAVAGSAQMTASGVGMLGVPGSLQMSASGVGMVGAVPGSLQYSYSGVGMLSMSGVAQWTTSGVGMLTTSGLGMLSMSGIGMFSAAVPQRPRQFWLIADAELIVYGATEPDATVTIGGQTIQLEADGTFRHHMSFQDGVIDYPILAVAADGVQTRSVHMRFERETLERRTNKKEEAIPEWIR